MHTFEESPLALRRALLLDAVATGAMAILLVFAAATLRGPLGLPEGLLRWAGLILLPFTALLLFSARRPRAPVSLTWAIIGCNVLWVLDSLFLLVSGWLEPTLLGTAFVAAQAGAVAIFACLQYAGLRRIDHTSTH